MLRRDTCCSHILPVVPCSVSFFPVSLYYPVPCPPPPIFQPRCAPHEANANGSAIATTNVIGNANAHANASAGVVAVVVDVEARGGRAADTGITDHVEDVGGGPPEPELADHSSADLSASVVSGDVASQAEATVNEPTLAGVQEDGRALMGMVQAQVGSFSAPLGLLTSKSTDINGMAVDAEEQKEEEVVGFSIPVGDKSHTRALLDWKSDLETAVLEAAAAAGTRAGRLEGAASGAEAGAAAAASVLAKVEAVESRAVEAESRVSAAEARATAAEEAVGTVTAEAATVAATAAAEATATAEASAAAAMQAAVTAASEAARRAAEEAHKAQKRSIGCHLLAGIMRRRRSRDKRAVLMAFRCAVSAAGATEAAARNSEDANRARVEAEEREAQAKEEVKTLERRLENAVDVRVAQMTSSLQEQLRKANEKLAAADRLEASRPRPPYRRAATAEHSTEFGVADEEKMEENAASAVRADPASPAIAAAHHASPTPSDPPATSNVTATGNGASPARVTVQVHFQAADDDNR